MNIGSSQQKYKQNIKLAVDSWSIREKESLGVYETEEVFVGDVDMKTTEEQK